MSIYLVLQKNKILIFSLILIIISIGSLITNKLNLSVTVAGGIEIETYYEQPINLNIIKNILKNIGIINASIQLQNDNKHIVIKVKDHKNINNQTIKHILLAFSEIKLQKTHIIYHQNHIENIITAIIGVFFGLFIYLILRFSFQFSIRTIIILLHDTVVTLGSCSVFNIECDFLSFIAIFMIIYYSFRNILITYHKMHSNLKYSQSLIYQKTLTTLINQISSKVIITSGLSFILMGIILVFGGEILRNFSIIMMISLIITIFSSCFITEHLLSMPKYKYLI